MRRIKNCMHHKTKLETIAKLAPLTATKCVNPDRFIWSLNCAVCLDVSPRTIPGMSEPESPPPEWVRNPVLIAPRAAAQREGGVISSKSLSTSSSAATRASFVRTTRAIALTVWPGRNSTFCFEMIRTGARKVLCLLSNSKDNNLAVKE